MVGRRTVPEKIGDWKMAYDAVLAELRNPRPGVPWGEEAEDRRVAARVAALLTASGVKKEGSYGD